MTNAFEMSLVNEHLHCLKAGDGFDKTSRKSHSTEKKGCVMSVCPHFWDYSGRLTAGPNLLSAAPTIFSFKMY